MSPEEAALEIIRIFDEAKRQALQVLQAVGDKPSARQRMLTAKEVAERINVPVSRVYDLRRSGRLPESVDLGGKDRYRWSERIVENFINPES